MAQDPRVIRPPEAQEASVIRSAPVGGDAALPEYELLTGSSVSALADPSSLSTTGTAYDPVTGIFTFNLIATATRYDGFREALPRFSIDLLDIYDDFDLELDILDIAMVVIDIPLSASIEKFGLAFGVLDTASGVDLSTADGILFGTYGNTAVAWAIGDMTTTGVGSDAYVGTPHWATARLSNGDEGLDMAANWRLKNTADAKITGEPIASAGARPVPSGNLFVHVAGFKNSTVATAASGTMQCQIYTRRIRTLGDEGLPT